MKFLEFMFVPTILFLTVVVPIWLTMHYRSVNRSSRGLNVEDREAVEHMLETADKLTDRIQALSPSSMWITRIGASARPGVSMKS